jgi:hypothetical protein
MEKFKKKGKPYPPMQEQTNPSYREKQPKEPTRDDEGKTEVVDDDGEQERKGRKQH